MVRGGRSLAGIRRRDPTPDASKWSPDSHHPTRGVFFYPIPLCAQTTQLTRIRRQLKTTHCFDHRNVPLKIVWPSGSRTSPHTLRNDFLAGRTCSLCKLACVRTWLDKSNDKNDLSAHTIKRALCLFSNHNSPTINYSTQIYLSRFICHFLKLSGTFPSGDTDQWCISGLTWLRSKSPGTRAVFIRIISRKSAFKSASHGR